MIYTLTKPDRELKGDIYLDGSKSISNRALIIRALCSESFAIDRLSTSKDTQTLEKLLGSTSGTLDAGAAGTTFRFLTAYLAIQPGVQVLTGSARMKKRPIGVLVDALRKLGADIEYLEAEGFPPLRINAPFKELSASKLAVAADMSSQYLSALLMIAPVLPNGLTLTLEGGIVSRPYLEMTLKMMAYFGVDHTWNENRIHVAPQRYRPKDLTVEADWSAASYWYAMSAFAGRTDLRLHGLFADSVQGDAILPEMMDKFGVTSEFADGHVQLSGPEKPILPLFEWDFLPCPDLAQTLAVVCAGLGVQGIFTGLETLRIKETDRIEALQTELAKVNCFLSLLPRRFSPRSTRDHYMLEGKADLVQKPLFRTYEDHRMAMAFAPLSLLGPVSIEHPSVVEKSYGNFWKDLNKAGFRIEEEQV